MLQRGASGTAAQLGTAFEALGSYHTHTQTHLGRQVKVEDQPEHHKLLIPNSESIGFQSLGPGTGDTKMHAPKNRNSPGTLLEPFAVGLQSWANCGLC